MTKEEMIIKCKNEIVGINEEIENLKELIDSTENRHLKTRLVTQLLKNQNNLKKWESIITDLNQLTT
jgi:cell division FtsZ-interacting protein ZapD